MAEKCNHIFRPHPRRSGITQCLLCGHIKISKPKGDA